MRIGIDLLAVPAPAQGRTELGRFISPWIEALAAADQGLSFVFYAHDGLPPALLPDIPSALLRRVRPDPERGEMTTAHLGDRLVRTNPDRLDVLVVLDPFERFAGAYPPSKPINGPRMVALLHDLHPLLFPQYDDASDPLQDHGRLEELRRYDALICLSESTRHACLSTLGLPADRLTMIGAACDRIAFYPRETFSRENAPRTLGSLGITRPFLLYTDESHRRRHLWALIEAFAQLPKAVQRRYQLVAAGVVEPIARDWIKSYALSHRVEDAVVVTGEMGDGIRPWLVRNCSAFVLPSHYEGIGLSLIEAMQSGVVVVAGNNSAQAEVVGDAGLLVNPADPNDIAARLTDVLQNPPLAQSLRQRALARARQFRWENVAQHTLGTLSVRNHRRKLPASSRLVQRKAPRIAFFSPWPPKKSGISDYSASLVDELSRDYTIDLYHDAGYEPETGRDSDRLSTREFRLFERYAPYLDYHAVVYQMGNSLYHNFMYELLKRHPGIVTLHDFCLVGFRLQYQQARGEDRRAFVDELLRWYPGEAGQIERCAKRWTKAWDWDNIGAECASVGWYLNGEVLKKSRRVIVHSDWCVEQARARGLEYGENMVVVPLGRRFRTVSPEERLSIRARFNLPSDALVFASFGFIYPDKMGLEAIGAFRSVAQSDPKALFAFVGEEADCGAVRHLVATLGLNNRVRFLGRRTLADFHDLIAVTDIGINLRRPPTNGETSAALLDLLGAGVATIVTDVGTFSGYPDTVVRKVRWQADGIDGLRREMLALARDPAKRHALGEAAQIHARRHHDWANVANLYRDIIEEDHEDRARENRQAHVAARLAVG